MKTLKKKQYKKTFRFHRPTGEPNGSPIAATEETIEIWREEYEKPLVAMEGYNNCILGIVEKHCSEPFILYDYDKVIEESMRQGMTYEEAVEWFDSNQSCLYAGENTYGFLRRPSEW